MKILRDICYSTETAQCLDVYLPEGDAFPVMLYFHGGGLEVGDKGDQKILFQHLTDQGIAVVSANYRMYPDAKYPDYLVDAAAAVAWTFQNMKSYGQVRGIYVGGSSAGGYLSQMLCFDPSWLGAHGIAAGDVAGFVHDAGQPTSHFNVLRERGIDSRRIIIDDSAPLYHVGRSESYPPMILIVSDEDIENRYEQTVLLASTLKHFGHEIRLKLMHDKHCAYVDAVDDNGESVFGKIVADFILG